MCLATREVIKIQLRDARHQRAEVLGGVGRLVGRIEGWAPLPVTLENAESEVRQQVRWPDEGANPLAPDEVGEQGDECSQGVAVVDDVTQAKGAERRLPGIAPDCRCRYRALERPAAHSAPAAFDGLEPEPIRFQVAQGSA